MHFDGGVVREHVDIGRLGADRKVGVVGDCGRRAEMRKLWHGGTRLEIGLAVEVLRLDIADILVLRRRADDQICRRVQSACVFSPATSR